jgi:hypothetical protein
MSVRLGSTASLNTTVIDVRGRPMEGARVRYLSSRPDVASVDSLTGVVTAVAVGVADVLVTAQPAHASVPVTVLPAGGDEVAKFGLDYGEPVWDDHANRYGVRLETWSLAPQAIRFHASNADGESLCGVVPLALSSDTSVFGARSATSGDPCVITLIPRAEGAGWLRVTAGAKRDSVWTVVHHTRYRWTMSLPEGPKVVGTNLTAEVAVVDETGKPAPGIPFIIENLAWVSSTLRAVTGADGIARISWTLPTTTLGYTLIPDSSETELGVRYQVFGRLDLPGEGIVMRKEIELRPAVPDHIEVLAYTIDSFEECELKYCEFRRLNTEYRPLTGDSVTLLFEHTINVRYSGGPPRCSHDDFGCPQPFEVGRQIIVYSQTLTAIVADRYGNPTPTVPAVAANSYGAGVTEVREVFVAGSRAPCCRWDHRLGGRVAVIGLREGSYYPVTVTLTSPGIPSRTVWVSAARR